MDPLIQALIMLLSYRGDSVIDPNGRFTADANPRYPVEHPPHPGARKRGQTLLMPVDNQNQDLLYQQLYERLRGQPTMQWT